MQELFNRKNLGQYQRDLRSSMTKSEAVLWKYLKGDQSGYRFRRQYGVGNYIVDFYCPKLKVAIEVDGSTHNEARVFEKDLVKQEYLEKLGILVKRYNSNDIFNNLDNILQDIKFVCDERAARLPLAPSLQRGTIR